MDAVVNLSTQTMAGHSVGAETRPSRPMRDDAIQHDLTTGASTADGTLLLRHAKGDGEAFAELVARYRAPVYGYLVRIGVDASARDDLFQEIFLRLHRAANRYQPSRPFQPWLFTIVANAARNHVRGRRLRRSRFVPTATASPEPPDPGPDGARETEGRETLDRVEAAIARLPRGQREVLILAAIERQPLADVATSLGVAVGTVKSRLSRARLALARVLADADRPATPTPEVSR